MFRLEAPTLKRRLRAGEPLGAVWFALGSPPLVELAIRSGADAVVLDLQHGLFERRDLEAAIGACPPEAPCLVRVESDGDAALARALDAGAEGVIVPMIETAEQAARAAAACHYPPLGRRSAGGVRPAADFAAYRPAAAAAIAVGVMIETATGLANAEAIAAARGVDFVFIGPGDLALSLGNDPAALEAGIAAILGACRRTGTPCGVFTFSPEAALVRREEGFAVTVIANDISTVAGAFATARLKWAGG